MRALLTDMPCNASSRNDAILRRMNATGLLGRLLWTLPLTLYLQFSFEPRGNMSPSNTSIGGANERISPKT